MLKEYGIEIKVGVLIFVALALAGSFLWILGDYTPLAATYNIYADYNFAGGVELGTPVRVSGIKVGKVTHIGFLKPGTKDASGKEIALRLKLNVSNKVREKIRKDSQFFINQAGIIGERYVEITPGSALAPMVDPDAVLRGVDPPRFDQLLSQGMGVFGDLSRILEENRGGIEKAAGAINRAGEALDQLVGKLSPEDIQKLRRIISRMDSMSADAMVLLEEMRHDLRPTLDSLRETLAVARPFISRADRLLKDYNDLADDYKNLPPERKKEIRESLSQMVETLQHLETTLDRLDRFTAMVDREYSDMDRKKIEKILREFLQQEGIRVNVGGVRIKNK